MGKATARLWREGARWVVQIDIDGVHYTERDYSSVPDACHASASILRQRGERRADLDEDTCESCDEIHRPANTGGPLERSRRARWKHGRYSREARDAARATRWNDPGYVQAQRQAAIRRFAREDARARQAARKQAAAFNAAMRRFGL
jgi:hypothetical protein